MYREPLYEVFKCEIFYSCADIFWASQANATPAYPYSTDNGSYTCDGEYESRFSARIPSPTPRRAWLPLRRGVRRRLLEGM
jgi:hypothetical protein